MREAGKIAVKTLEMIEEFIKPGVSTGELDSICHKFITEDQKCIPAPLNYKSFLSLFALLSIKWCVMEFQVKQKF